MADETRDAREALSRRIERLRQERGWTFDELAERAGCEPPQLRSLLDRYSDVSVFVIDRLSRALGVGLEELLGGIEWVPDGKGGGEYRVEDPEDG